jgi:hypothetical protein
MPFGILPESESSPPRTRTDGLWILRKARCPSDLAAVTALRAGRDDPRVQHPQDVCDSPRAAARRSLNTPGLGLEFLAGPSSSQCPTPTPSPSPSPSLSGTPSPSGTTTSTASAMASPSGGHRARHGLSVRSAFRVMKTIRWNPHVHSHRHDRAVEGARDRRGRKGSGLAGAGPLRVHQRHRLRRGAWSSPAPIPKPQAPAICPGTSSPRLSSGIARPGHLDRLG